MHTMPPIGLGTWKLHGKEGETIVRQALDLGYQHIDTADAYQNHPSIGKAIQHCPREGIFLTTKIALDKLDSKEIEQSIPRFLKELQTDYIDLLLIHWPNPNADLKKALETMVSFQERGLVRSIGVSNFVRFHLEELGSIFPIMTNQIELHPYLQRKSLVKACQKLGIRITAYRPLAKGAFEKDLILQGIGSHHKKTPSQVVLRWMVQQGISPIPKASSLEHLKSNLEIFDFALSADEMDKIEALDQGKRFCAPENYPVYED